MALVSHSAPLSFYLLVFLFLTSVQAQAALSIAMLGDLSGGCWATTPKAVLRTRYGSG